MSEASSADEMILGPNLKSRLLLLIRISNPDSCRYDYFRQTPERKKRSRASSSASSASAAQAYDMFSFCPAMVSATVTLRRVGIC